MKKFIDQCCVQCTHTAKTPCRDFIVCRVEGPLCHDNAECAGKRKVIIKRVALNEKFVIC